MSGVIDDTIMRQVVGFFWVYEKKKIITQAEFVCFDNKQRGVLIGGDSLNYVEAWNNMINDEMLTSKFFLNHYKSLMQRKKIIEKLVNVNMDKLAKGLVLFDIIEKRHVVYVEQRVDLNSYQGLYKELIKIYFNIKNAVWYKE